MKAAQLFVMFALFCVAIPATAKEKILIISAEQTGVFNTGGLGHTVAGLAKAFAQSGNEANVLMPFYSRIEQTFKGPIVDEGFDYSMTWGLKDRIEFKLYSVTPPNGVKTYLLKAISPANFFENTQRPGEPLGYTNHPHGMQAFAIFSKMAATFVSRRRFSVINTHDWHTGLVGYFLKEYKNLRLIDLRERRLIFTISNLGYQGLLSKDTVPKFEVHPAHFIPEQYEFYGQFNMMKVGIKDSDAVLTVSKNYLDEILTPRFGNGLEGFLKAHSAKKPVAAITNGADLEAWTPKDFSPDDLVQKHQGKLQIQKILGLQEGLQYPLFALTPRIAHQKGYDYLPLALEKFLQKNAQSQIIVMGDGDAQYIKNLESVAAKFPGRMIYSAFRSELEIPVTKPIPWRIYKKIGREFC